jgi:hypothetical protein
MSLGRRRGASSSAALALALAALAASPQGRQEVSLGQVLTRAARYTADLERESSGIVAEERYVQDARGPDGDLYDVDGRRLPTHRELRSDLLLVRVGESNRYQAFRDVYEVDGDPVRDRKDRLSRLFLGGARPARNQLQEIVAESARYNIGAVERTINHPMYALLFLGADIQRRFVFERVEAGATALGTVALPAAWVVAYREVRPNTLIRTKSGADLFARGRFWVEPDSGMVLATELVVESETVHATIDVAFRRDSELGAVVPVEMRERYEGTREGTVVLGTATYGRFRRFQVSVDESIALEPKP